MSHNFLLRFALVWLLTVFIGLSFASAKRPLYLGPLFPAFALAAALGWDRLREKFPKVKRVEIYGLIFIFLAYAGTYLFFITPSENKRSLRPVFDVVSSQQAKNPVYLVNTSESIRGASFFYLGKRIPVLDRKDLLSGRFEGREGTVLVVDIYSKDPQLLSDLSSKGYRRIFHRRYGKDEVYVFSNAS
jgi:4-amino-4-deoxy-L-arabinose transferase-like glycosyltransferase